MFVETQYPLQAHNSFGISAKAQRLVCIRDEADIDAVLADVRWPAGAALVLDRGGGSR